MMNTNFEIIQEAVFAYLFGKSTEATVLQGGFELDSFRKRIAVNWHFFILIHCSPPPDPAPHSLINE